MAPYHIALVHFPVALWVTAMLAIVWRALSDGPMARRVDQALVPLLTLALWSGLAAYAVGTQVWPWEAISASALGRNHLMLAAWTVALWAVILWLRWRGGEAVWQGVSRWVMAVLALLGSAMLIVTATLGGYLTGTSTGLSEVLRRLGWEVYTTFYVPTFTLWALLAIAVLLVALGWWARAGRAAAMPRGSGNVSGALAAH